MGVSGAPPPGADRPKSRPEGVAQVTTGTLQGPSAVQGCSPKPVAGPGTAVPRHARVPGLHGLLSRRV